MKSPIVADCRVMRMPDFFSCCWISSRAVWFGPKLAPQMTLSESFLPSLVRMPSEPVRQPAASRSFSAPATSWPSCALRSL